METKMLPASRFSESHFLSSSVEEESFHIFKKWVLSTYGDGSKTKTVTWSKYHRIQKVLSGRSIGESPKFKFWVKSKGLCFLPCPKLSGRPSEFAGMVIAIPNKKTSNERVYKRVAVVEEFFDIIYDIHVNIDGRNGKHAGQKRTYRRIIESYAFLPREAVTHFLMSCKECRGRMHLAPPTKTLPWSPQANQLTSSPRSITSLTPERCSSPALSEISIDVCSDSLSTMSLTEDNMSSSVVEECLASSERGSVTTDAPTVDEVNNTAVPTLEAPSTPLRHPTPKVNGDGDEQGSHETSCVKEEALDTPMEEKEQLIEETPISIKKEEATSEKVLPKFPLISSPLKRSADSSLNLSPTMSKKSSDDADDDDDDDDDDKILSNSGVDIDPERLKAFNMFCRLFVDENLDRLVPISKQPKDKVQKILDACDRQFPEFRDRSRKRIRTYLKSCRRMRRTRETNGQTRETSRPTPPHLTSPVAEHLLSVACENEAKNIRLINMGLEPHIATPRAKPVSNHLPASTLSSATALASMPSLVPANLAHTSSHSAAQRMFPSEWRFPQAAPFRPDLAPFFGNGFFRPPFPGFPGHLPGAALQASQAAATQLSLHSQSMNDMCAQKKSAQSLSMPSTPNKSSALSSTEISSLRQLIIGYRESATFLSKSADELEQLIAHTN